MKSERAVRAAAALVSAALVGCTDPNAAALFPPEVAQATALQFHERLKAGDADALAAISRAPFRYKEPGRVWRSDEDIRANLRKEVPRIQHLVQDLDKVEVFSRYDLGEGRWPRNREVPPKRREAEIGKLGVEENGWVVRIYAEGRPGYLLVLNADSSTQLKAQALDI